ncbi:UNVERIFIED_CONTAM: hypothetical protein RMT77_006128 [Armadillidium vulgare]
MFKCIPARIVLAFLCATGLMELYMTRINLSIAVVEMVQVINSETVQNDTSRQPFCLQHQNTSFFYDLNVNNETSEEENEVKRNATIKLSTTQRGYILSSFFYAYGISAILGGRLGEKYGTKKILGTAVLFDILGNLLIPVASKFSYILIIVIRCVMGFFQGMCYPSMYALLSTWIPKSESSRFIGSVLLANNFGSIFTLQVGGIIVSEFGYEMIFYASALMGLIWLLFWVLFMYDYPETHPRISEKERIYILENRAKSENGKKKTPWLKLFTSLRVLAICIAHAGSMFGLIFLVTQLPIYLSSVIGINIKANGFLSSLPFLARYLGSNLNSWLINFLMKKSKWTLKTWYRVCTFIGHWCTGFCILLVGYVGCNSTAVLLLFSLAMFLNGTTCSGYLCNHFQIAPDFAGTVSGMTNTLAFCYTTFGPIIVGALTPEETLGEWINVYWFIFASYFICGLFFMIFLSTELQPWNEITEKPLQEDARDIQELESLQKVCESNGLSTELQPWNEITEKPLQEDARDIQELESLQKVCESNGLSTELQPLQKDEKDIHEEKILQKV